MVLPVVPVARVIGLLEPPGLPERAETLIRGVRVARRAAVVGVGRGGFGHGPFLPEQAPRGQPSLARGTLIEAMAPAGEVTVTTRREMRAAGEQTH